MSTSGGVARHAGIARYAGTVKAFSFLVILGSMLVTAGTLPVDRGVAALSATVEQMGPLGPVVFGIVYVIAAVLFIPGSALTLAAGGVFGLVTGVITVSLSSTTAAAVAFLIARYLARARIEEKVKSVPRFAAIDRAIGEGGAKIIALLRLSPAVPFSIGNYMFGLTAIGFWPYLIASWIFMLPGTVMYVYLGHVAKESLASAAGGESGKTAGEWGLLVVGLLATVAVTVYVTRIARRALKQQMGTVEESGMMVTEPNQKAPARTGWPMNATLLAIVAVVMASGAAYAMANKSVISGLFGPAPVTMTEAYRETPGSPRFDHSAFDALLKQHVDEHGFVDYAGLASDASKLDGYIAALRGAPFDALGRNEKLAFLINAYNAFTLRLILDNLPIDSIKDIPGRKRWDAVRWRVGGYTWSLNQIEHEQIRPNFAEPRIHFALVCAAVGCPKLRNEAYAAKRLEEQLADQLRYAHTHDRWFRFDASANAVYLTKLYKWYGGDFKQIAGSVLDFAARSSHTLKQALASGKKPKIKWLAYDWALNDKRNSGK